MLTVGLAASIPVIAAVARVLAAAEFPVSDNAVLAVRAYDTLTAHSPLLGPHSLLSDVIGESVRSPGPLLYWLLALPARFIGPTGLTLTMGLVGLSSTIGIVAVAHRRGGRVLMFGAAIALAVMCESLPDAALQEVWNPYAGLLPFTFLMFLAWSVACGDYRLLPLTVLVASYVAQCHLTYALPALGMLVVGAAGLVVARRRARSSVAPPQRRRRTLGDPFRRSLVFAVVVGLICWSAPLIDQATNRPGNLAVLAEAAIEDQDSLGARAGWHGVVRAVGVPPWWLQDPRGRRERIVDIAEAPSPTAIVSTAIALAALITVALLSGRRHPEVAAAAIIGLVLCVALAAAVASTPSEQFPVLAYTSLWGSPAGMWVWLTLVWGAARLLPLPERLVAGRWKRVAPVAGALAVACVGILVAARAEPNPAEWAYGPARAIAASLQKAVPPGASVLVVPVGSAGSFFDPAAVYALRRHGVNVVTPPSDPLTSLLGSHYEATEASIDEVVLVEDGDAPVPAGNRLIARIPVPDAPAEIGGGRVPAAERTISVIAAPPPETPPTLTPDD